MIVQPITKTITNFKLILTAAEKAQRKFMINKLVNQVVASNSEFVDTKDMDIKLIRRLVTKKYDALIRAKVMQSI
jgi:predicted methyltransferase MtxX (methanogen marker protein 4)